MAVKERTSGGKDAAYLASGSTTKVHNDLYEGRMTDADLEYCDGHPLEEREEWNLAKVARRGKWQADPED
jgi:hypothetical protein